MLVSVAFVIFSQANLQKLMKKIVRSKAELVAPTAHSNKIHDTQLQ
jgi:hypothetical protein